MRKTMILARVGAAALFTLGTMYVSAQDSGTPNTVVKPSGQPSSSTPGAPGSRIDSSGNLNGQNGSQDPMTTPSASSSSDSAMAGSPGGDKGFVREAIMGNHAEIDAANLALQKSSNDQVKQGAQKMIDDHTKMLNDMTAIAGQLGVQAPGTASNKDKAMAAKLSAMSGTDFDKAYVKEMVKDHTKDVQDFTRESQSGSNSQVKAAAAKSLPIIQSHLAMWQDLNKNMSNSASK